MLQNPINHQLSVAAAPPPQIAQPLVSNPLVSNVLPATIVPSKPLINGSGSVASPAIASQGQSSSSIVSSLLTSAAVAAIGGRNQPVPEEKLTVEQSRKKQEALDHKAAGEGNLEREEKLEISGKDARYMMMQKLARQTAVSIVFQLLQLIRLSRI